MNKWTMIKKSTEDWKVIEKDNKYQIEGPKGLYKDENGKIYEFDTREKALEEVEYLKAEHKYDKKEAKLKKKAEQSASSKLIDLMDEGVLNPRTVVNSCLRYMSEDEIEDMAIREGYIDKE